MIHRNAMAAVAALSSLGLAFMLPNPAVAGTITDPANDFVLTFAGTSDPSLDVLSLSVTFDGSTFHISATENGDIASFASGLFVIGFNRGAATSNFASIGHPGVVFDSVITLTSGGVTGGRDLVAGTPITLPANSAHITGNTFTIDVPANLLPSEGLAPSQYAINLWPRDASVAAGATQIADFAPDNSVLAVAVPEPASVPLLATALLSMVAAIRRRS